jgi:hypothetical protein
VRTLIDDVLLNPLVSLPLGLLFAIIFALQLADIPEILSRLKHVENLQPRDAAAPGQAAFVEGHISSLSPAVYRRFVAYLREEYRSVGKTSRWVEVERQTPPLVIEAHGRSTRIVNNDYELETTRVSVEEEPATFTRGASRSRGVVVAGAVLAVGSAAEEPEGLVAEFLYAGTRAEYVAYLRRYLENVKWWGGGMLIGSIGFIILGVWRLRRFLREINITEKPARSQPIGRIKGSNPGRAARKRGKKR